LHIAATVGDDEDQHQLALDPVHDPIPIHDDLAIVEVADIHELSIAKASLIAIRTSRVRAAPAVSRR
jgi:hypothetical protein